MTMKPLQEWTCDRCHQLIREPSHGMVEYEMIHDAQKHRGFEKGLRLVHRLPHSPRDHERGCSFYIERWNADLPEYLGPDGLSELLLLLDRANSCESADPAEVLELIRRLHIPYYEEARRYRGAAAGDNLLDGLDPRKFFFQEQLKAVVERYTSDDACIED
jgi:hypothetical protein